jgi:hypothetical protein
LASGFFKEMNLRGANDTALADDFLNFGVGHKRLGAIQIRRFEYDNKFVRIVSALEHLLVAKSEFFSYGDMCIVSGFPRLKILHLALNH